MKMFCNQTIEMQMLTSENGKEVTRVYLIDQGTTGTAYPINNCMVIRLDVPISADNLEEPTIDDMLHRVLLVTPEDHELWSPMLLN